MSQTLPDKKAYIFDLDGTLAESKAPLSDEMASVLERLLQNKKVAIISGGNFPQFEEQVIHRLKAGDGGAPVEDAILRNLFIFPTSGARMYAYGIGQGDVQDDTENGGWKMVYAELLSEEEKAKIITSLKQVIENAPFEKPTTLYGEQIEDRDSQITFSALGQRAPVDIKKAWDPDLSKKRYLVNALSPMLPECSVNTGGSTSVDIVKKGIDKAYGLEKLSEYLSIPISDMCYIGDALYEDGNDAVVKKTGVETVQVQDVGDTIRLLQEYLEK